MKTLKVTSLVTLALCALSPHSFAITVDMKPGLWEQTFKLSDSGVGAVQKAQQVELQRAMDEMEKRFAEMPAEQRQQIEQMMKDQGVDMGPAGLAAAEQGLQMLKNGTVVQTCVTQAEIDKGELPSPEKNCANTVKQLSRNVFKISYECKGENPSRGSSEVTFQNPKSYTGTVSYAGPDAMTIQGTVVGKWLASDCGGQSESGAGFDDQVYDR